MNFRRNFTSRGREEKYPSGLIFFFYLVRHNSQRVRVTWASGLTRKINRPMKTQFFHVVILSCTSQEVLKHMHYHCYHIFPFFWIRQIILNESGMSIPTKHFWSPVALEGDNSRKWFIQAFLERRIRFIIKIKRTVSCMVIMHFPHCLRWILQWVRSWANGEAVSLARCCSVRRALARPQGTRRSWSKALTLIKRRRLK